MNWYVIDTQGKRFLAADIAIKENILTHTHYAEVKDGIAINVWSGHKSPKMLCNISDILGLEWIEESIAIGMLETGGFMLEDGVIKKKSSIDWDNIRFGETIYVMDTVYADERDVEVVPIKVTGGRFIYIFATDENNLKMWYIKTTDVKSLIEAE